MNRDESSPRGDLGRALLVALLLVFGNAAWVGATTGFISSPDSVLETDHWRYLAMADGPRRWATVPLARQAPYNTRVLAPLLAFGLSRTGLDLNLSFYILTNLALIGFLATLHLYLRALGFEIRYALLGTVLVGFVPGAVRWYEYQYWMTDPLCLFLIALSLLLAVRRRDTALAAVGGFGVATRESYLLVLPWYFARRLRRDGAARAIGATALVAIAPLAVLAALHYLLPPLRPAPSYLTLARKFLPLRLAAWPTQLYLLSAGSFGVLFPLLALPPRRGAKLRVWRGEDLVYLAGVVSTLAVANNTDRLLAYALPAVLPAALRRAQSLDVPFPALAAILVTLQLVVFSSVRYGGAGTSVYQPANALVASMLFLSWLAALARRAR